MLVYVRNGAAQFSLTYSNFYPGEKLYLRNFSAKDDKNQAYNTKRIILLKKINLKLLWTS
jgi:hypothetical protein